MCFAHSGLLPSLIGVCHVAIQFPLYEWSKKKLAERSGAPADNLDPAYLVRPLLAERDIALAVRDIALLCWLCMTPLDYAVMKHYF